MFPNTKKSKKKPLPTVCSKQSDAGVSRKNINYRLCGSTKKMVCRRDGMLFSVRGRLCVGASRG